MGTKNSGVAESLDSNRKLFGTDGVRGVANLEPVTAETAPELKTTIQRVRVVAENLASTSARVDQILAKISRDGEAALSDEERRILVAAAEVYKARQRL